MSSLRIHRAESAYISYPAYILDREPLVQLGLIPGLTADGSGVIMSRADWGKLVWAVKRDQFPVHRALEFLGKTWETNPLIERPEGESDSTLAPSSAMVAKKPRRPRYQSAWTRPGQFGHLRGLPVEDAMRLARADHERRLAAGVDEAESLDTFARALATIRRDAENRVEPRPLPAISGEEPPSPMEMKRRERREKGRKKRQDAKGEKGKGETGTAVATTPAQGDAVGGGSGAPVVES